MSEVLVTEVDGGVGTIVLSRPQALNALDADMAAALASSVAAFSADAAVRVVVIRGAGDHFMAGGDINYFHESLEAPGAERQARVGAIIDAIHGAIGGLVNMEKPVVASVRGACAGFGISLMAACDLALAARGTTFSLAYRHIGASPDGGSTWLLPRLVGHRRAMELALLGERFDAERAFEMGLVNRVVDAAALDAETAALADALAKGPARAQAVTKGLLNRSSGAGLEDQLGAEKRAFVAGVAGPEFEEGVRAFVAKRPPEFP